VLIVTALGGNALLRRGEPMSADNMRKNVRIAAKALAPVARKHKLVVGHGIGDSAVEDATEAYRKAWESRREKAFHAAQMHEHENGKHCVAGEHLILGA